MELLQAVEIIVGVGGRLKMDLDFQARLVVGETGTITLNIQNVGNTDVVGPLMVMDVSGKIVPTGYFSQSAHLFLCVAY